MPDPQPQPPQPPATQSAINNPQSAIDSLLSRPADQRLREHKYRFGQAFVFGLPVLALQWWGPSLGGEGSARWVAAFQALLSGWVVYVGATGMAFEGALVFLHCRRVTADLAVSLVAVGLYAWSAAWLPAVVFSRRPPADPPTLFHGVVLLVAAWAGLQWWRLSRWRPAR